VRLNLYVCVLVCAKTFSLEYALGRMDGLVFRQFQWIPSVKWGCPESVVKNTLIDELIRRGRMPKSLAISAATFPDWRCFPTKTRDPVIQGFDAPVARASFRPNPGV
jgi:hypothetical protein